MSSRRKRKRRRAFRAAPLTESLILAWADLYHERTGRWPEELRAKAFDSFQPLGENHLRSYY